MHRDVPGALDVSTAIHRDAQGCTGGSRCEHRDAQGALDVSTAMHRDAQGCTEGSRCDHSNAQGCTGMHRRLSM